MEILLLFGLLALFLLPSFFMMRKQRKQQEDIRSFQNSLQPGQQVITAGGIHLHVTEVLDDSVRGEIADGVEVTMEKVAIVRSAETAVAADESAGLDYDEPTDDTAYEPAPDTDLESNDEYPEEKR